MGRKSVTFTNVDTAWLHMEHPTNLMMVSGVVQLARPASFDRLKETIERGLLRFDRFKQRVADSRLPLRNPLWEFDPHFSLENHVHRIALPSPGDQATLLELASDLMSTPLDFSRPLWQFHLVENVGEGCAVICRLHHCIADGVALVGVMLSMMDLEENPSPKPAANDDHPKGEEGWHPYKEWIEPAVHTLEAGAKVATTLVHESMETLVNPERARNLVHKASQGASALSKLLLLPPDPKTPFKGKLGVRKRAAISEPIPLAEVKKIGKAMGAKVNDVLLGAMTGSLRRYLINRGWLVDGLEFHAAVPVNLRPPEKALELGNNFGLVLLPLPVGVADPVERLFELKSRMDEIKDTPEAVVALGLLNVIGLSPGQLVNFIMTFFGTKATAVMTNVPGPPFTLYLAGSAIKDVMFWVPQSGRLGLGVSILSYDGRVTLGVATDAGLIPDPEVIVQGFHEEFAALRELIMSGD
ncbi:MAG: wax ester/triacylglycerol synthase family O-acyltransferase [Chloroflexota bacterium]